MAIHLITGYAGVSHITAEDHGGFNSALFGDVEAIIDIGGKFNAEIDNDVNKIKIYDGEAIMQGRHVRIKNGDFDGVEIENGTSGMNRNDIIVIRYTKEAKSTIEKVELVAIKGAETSGNATDPAVTTGNILSENCLIHEMPLYRIRLNGVNIAGIDLLADVVQPITGMFKNNVLAVANGGTGATTVAGARHNLGLGNTAGALPIANGGTGATNVAGIRNNLGLGNTNGALPVANGGTGANTAAQALKNLGINVSAAVLNLLSGVTTNVQTQLNGKSNNGHNHDERYFTESEINSKLSGKSDTSHNHDGRYLRQYGLNEINIDSTGGVWTVDISENGHGTVPATWVNVTQTTSGHFTIQTAIKCNKDTNASRPAGTMWIRDKYTGGSGGIWSAWSRIATTSEMNDKISTLHNEVVERYNALEDLIGSFH